MESQQNTLAIQEKNDRKRESICIDKVRLAEKLKRQKIDNNDSVMKTRHVRIDNFQRPLSVKSLINWLGEMCEELISEDSIWINLIKTHCYIDFASIDSAENCICKVNGAKFPSTNPNFLVAHFTAVSAKCAPIHPEAALKYNEWLKLILPGKSDQNEKSQIDLVYELSSGLNERENSAVDKIVELNEETDKVADNIVVNSLERFFRVTYSCPQLYWVPVGTEIAEARKKEEEERALQTLIPP